MKRSLSQIVADFRERFRLSKAKAAQVLGVSTLYMRSLEQGVDVRTGLPFKPRDGTLLQLAAKMTEFGYPVTFDELKVAAGLAPAEEKAPELDDEGREAAQRLANAVKSSPAYRQIAKEARLQVLESLNIPDDVQDPPDEWELEVIAKIGGMDWGDLDPRKDTWFWYLDKAARRRRLRDLGLTWMEEQEIRRERGQA